MLPRVQPCFSSTPRLNAGHRETKPTAPKSLGDCFGRRQYLPGIQHAPAAEVPRDKLSAARRFSERFRTRFEAQRQLAATELRIRCASVLGLLPPAPVQGAVCGFDKLERELQTSACSRREIASGPCVATCIGH